MKSLMMSQGWCTVFVWVGLWSGEDSSSPAYPLSSVDSRYHQSSSGRILYLCDASLSALHSIIPGHCLGHLIRIKG